MIRDELLRVWVEALESGKYEQGYGTLRTPAGEYCCLGVLCEISGQGHWEENERFSGMVVFEWEGEHVMYLPPPWRDIIGLSWEDQRDLANANDRGESFSEIAQRIRRLFPDVFATVDA